MSGADGEGGGEKSYAPSQKRLEDARKSGDIARSPDLLAGAALAALAGVIMGQGRDMLARAGDAAMAFLAHPDRFGTDPVAILRQLGAMLAPLLPLFLAPAVAALAVLLATRGIVFAPARLEPKFSNISPLAGLSRRFGADGLIDFAKSLAKFLGLGAVLLLFLRARLAGMAELADLGAAQAAGRMMQDLGQLVTLMAALAVGIGVADYALQWFRHNARLRMTRQDLTDEAKENEGDPHARAHRRRRGQEIALNRMLADVARADVVVVNPTHYAVALRWRRGSQQAPVVVAKGVDDVAARIRARAAQHGVPLHSDPPTARALHAAVAIGQPIAPEHYRAVAAAIRFAEAMRRRARTWGGIRK